MQIGDIVVAKRDSRLIGEVTAIDDYDRAIVKLNASGVEVLIDLCDLYNTDSNQPQRESGKIVHILGTEYKILIIDESDYRYSKDVEGWCDTQAKEIILYNLKQNSDSVRDLVAFQNKVLRHEIVHAFLYESGLWQSSCVINGWAQNEEMVDWIAIQEPKINKAFKEAECDG